MKKQKIYEAGLIYFMKLMPKTFTPRLTRYFRDVFKPFFDAGVQIQKDIDALKEKYKEAEELNKEYKLLMEEEIEITKLPNNIFDHLEEAKVEINVAELNLLEEVSDKKE